MCVYTCWGQKTTLKSQVSPSTMHVLVIKFRSSALAANNLTHWVTLLTVFLVLVSNGSRHIFMMIQHINHIIYVFIKKTSHGLVMYFLFLFRDHFNQQKYEFYKHLLFVSASACSLCARKPICVSGKVILSEARDCVFFSFFRTLRS